MVSDDASHQVHSRRPLCMSFLEVDASLPYPLTTLTVTTSMRVDLYGWNVQATHPYWFDSMEIDINM